MGPTISETSYGVLTSAVDTDVNTATMYPVYQPAQSAASTDVTKGTNQ